MGRHLEAVETTITAAKNVLDGRHSALLELVRTLARQMDVAGADPSTRLSAAYLSALKDLGRVVASVAPVTGHRGLDELRRGRQTKKVPRQPDGMASRDRQR